MAAACLLDCLNLASAQDRPDPPSLYRDNVAHFPQLLVFYQAAGEERHPVVDIHFKDVSVGPFC